jgi:hypothetical protein
MTDSLDEVLASTVNQYLSGDKPTGNRIQNAELPYSDLNTEYALTSDEYTAFLFQRDGEKGARVEFKAEDPSQKIEEIDGEAGMEQQTEWRYGTENAIASLSTTPGQAILEIHQGYENPEDLLEKL